MQLWVADEERGLMRLEDGACCLAGPPGTALCAGWGRVYCAGQHACACYDRRTGETLFEVPLPTGVCGLTVLGSRLCALSSDADSVTAFSALTGEVLFSAPAGMYPRDLCASRQGRYLAVAGGAAGSLLLLDDCMRPVREYRLPGTVCGVCFLPRCLAALCAVEQGDITARLMRISFRGVKEETAAAALVPSCLCPLADGGCAVGCMGEVALFKQNKKAALRLPYPCPVRIRQSAWGPLICDACRGDVTLLNGQVVYGGKSPQDALLLP